MKIIVAAFVGFLVGLLIFAVGREVWLSFEARPAGEVVSQALSAIGSLKWIDTTLITGLAAVGAAYLSVTAVREQIRQDKQMEADRNIARHDAVRAVLPLALSNVCQYAIGCGGQLRSLAAQCQGGRLPHSVNIPAFPVLPAGAIDSLKEFIETSSHGDRDFVAKLLSKIQVQISRLQGMRSDRPRGTIILSINIEDHILDAAEIYGRATALFEYARGDSGTMPDRLLAPDVYPALSAIGIWDTSRERFAERIGRRFPPS